MSPTGTLGERASLAVATLWVCVALNLWAALAELSFSPTESRVSSTAVDVPTWAAATWGTVVAAAFLFWFHLAYNNLSAMGVTGLRRGVDQAIYAWVVPVANIAWPKQMMNDLWRTSDPAMPASDAEWHGRPTPRLMDAWWALFCLSGLPQLGQAMWWAAGSEHTPPFTEGWAPLAHDIALAGDVIAVAAAVLAIWVIREITARQTLRLTLQTQQGGQAPQVHATEGTVPGVAHV